MCALLEATGGYPAQGRVASRSLAGRLVGGAYLTYREGYV
jgi:hypothetical protein